MNRLITCLLLSVLLANTAFAGVLACTPMSQLKNTQNHTIQVQELPCHSQIESHKNQNDCEDGWCSLLCTSSLLALETPLSFVVIPEFQVYALISDDALFSREQSPPKRPPKYRA